MQLHIAPSCNAMRIARLACSLCCCPGPAVHKARSVPCWAQAQRRPCCKALPGRGSVAQHEDCLQMWQISVRCVPVAAWPLGKGQARSQLTIMQPCTTTSAVMPDKLRKGAFWGNWPPAITRCTHAALQHRPSHQVTAHSHQHHTSSKLGVCCHKQLEALPHLL